MGPTSLNMSTDLSKEAESVLLQVAREAIAHMLTYGCRMHVDLDKYASELHEKRATFVTLHLYQELRGCVGSLEAYQPLATDVAYNAYAAAFCDPRFSALTEDEFKDVEIHITILNPAEEISFKSEEDLLSQLRPHVDGLILSDGDRRGTFLPAVWESLPEPREFLKHLKLKAGLPVNYWSDTLRVKRYTATAFPKS